MKGRSNMTRWCLAALMLPVAMVASSALGGPRVGNGGDQLRLAFANAKQHAAHVTLRLNPRAIAPSVRDDVRKWLLDHQSELAADIAATPHEWVEETQPSCAWTQTTPAAKITFSYPSCKAALGGAGNDPHLRGIGIGDMDQAGALLVHESVHHLGITDEEFADEIALAVYGAWKSGDLEWLKTNTTNAPDYRFAHTAVWAGQHMLVFGGAVNQARTTASNSLHRYDPDSDKWETLSAAGAPSARYNALGVWTGKQLVIWGGFILKNGSPIWQNNGGVWSAQDGWRTIQSPYGPAELMDRSTTDESPLQSMVWTGKEAIIFGGAPVAGKQPGGILDPTILDQTAWRMVAPMYGSQAKARVEHSAVWTGSKMIVWGGNEYVGNMRTPVNTGAVYDLAGNRWSTLDTSRGAPSARYSHTAVWTGAEMIVFGGFDNGRRTTDGNIGDGAVWTEAGGWKAFTTEATMMRYMHTAVWTGAELLIYGGKVRIGMQKLNSVAAFNPINGNWRIVSSETAPAKRSLHSAVWTGRSMIVFGGQVDSPSGQTATNSGGIFYP